jgi:hypothetical protein
MQRFNMFEERLVDKSVSYWDPMAMTAGTQLLRH